MHSIVPVQELVSVLESEHSQVAPVDDQAVCKHKLQACTDLDINLLWALPTSK